MHQKGLHVPGSDGGTDHRQGEGRSLEAEKAREQAPAAVRKERTAGALNLAH